jgi:lysophospholipase L1-like esterase
LVERGFRLPPLAVNLLLASAAVVVAVGTLEGLAQVLTRLGVLHAYSAMQTMVPAGADDWRIAHITGDDLREPDPVLFWRPVAASPYSSQRFKGPEVAEVKPPGTFRVFCYGDSNTDGPRRGGWPERLQEVLDRDAVSSGQRFEVLNAGVAGYSSYQGLLRFRGEVGRFDPDLVLFSFGWNDLAPAIGKPDKEFEAPSGTIVAVQRVLLHFRFYRVALNYLRPAARTATSDSDSPRVAIGDYVANARAFADLARDHGARVALLTRPHRDAPALLARTPNWRASVPLYNEALLRFGTESGVSVLDAQEAFAGQPDRFADECHFTLEGHAAMATWLAAALRSAALLPR